MHKSTPLGILGFFIAIGSIGLYFFIGTGLHGDDYSVIVNIQEKGLQFIAFPPGLMQFNLGSYYGFWWAYYLLGFEHQWVYDLVKAVAHMLSLIFVYRFAIDYLPRDRALLFSALFVFYPLHDTTMYWYMTVPYILFPALLMFSHAMIRHDRMLLGFSLALLGAFSGYFSPPYMFGLATVFLAERQVKKAKLFALPGILYVAYYFGIKYALPGVERRINSSLTVGDFLRQLVLQPLSFFDAAIGPSYWLKIYYAIGSLGLASGMIALCIVYFLFLKAPSLSKRPHFPKSLFLGLTCILLLSFGMFALTGLYLHSAFNLGNRTTVYGSLLIAFLLAMLPMNRKTIVFFALIFIFPVFGLSDYWKSWNEHQKVVIENIRNNQELAALKPESTLIVMDNIYSKLGPFSHIELFSMPWVVDPIFRVSVKSQNIIALTSYIKLDQQTLIDPKFSGNYDLSGPIYLYNSEKNIVRHINVSDVPQLLASRPREIRHWVQLAKGTWIESGIEALSPRLAYLFL